MSRAGVGLGAGTGNDGGRADELQLTREDSVVFHQLAQVGSQVHPVLL